MGHPWSCSVSMGWNTKWDEIQKLPLWSFSCEFYTREGWRHLCGLPGYYWLIGLPPGPVVALAIRGCVLLSHALEGFREQFFSAVVPGDANNWNWGLCTLWATADLWWCLIFALYRVPGISLFMGSRRVLVSWTINWVLVKFILVIGLTGSFWSVPIISILQ